MTKKLAVLLSLALVLVAFCAFASAEDKLELYTPNGQGFATPSRVVNKAIDAEAKALVDVYPARGATVTLWYWNDGTGCYNMKTGNQVDQVRYTVLGNFFGVEILTGGAWLDLYDEPGFGEFSWDMYTNYGTASRKGKMRVYDSYGTICYIEIRQCCDMDIVKVTQLDGWNHDGRVRVQSTKASGTHGKVYYNVGSYYEYNYEYQVVDAMTPRKFIRGKIWFHPNRPVGTWQYYYLRPYRVMGGQNRQGPRTDVWMVQVLH